MKSNKEFVADIAKGNEALFKASQLNVADYFNDVCDELTGGRFFFRPMQGSGDERDAHICLDWETVTSMSAGAVLHPNNQTKIQATPADLAWFNTRWHEAVRKRQEQNLRGECIRLFGAFGAVSATRTSHHKQLSC